MTPSGGVTVVCVEDDVVEGDGGVLATLRLLRVTPRPPGGRVAP